MSIQGKPGRLSRKAFIGLGGMSAAALAVSANYRGPLHALGARAAEGQPPSAAAGYGPLVPKGDLALPAEFNYQVIDRQGIPMRDGRLTPGIFDAMGAYPDTGGGVNPPGDTTILIRNHENRERPGEIKVITGPEFEYDETAFGGCTKIVVERERAGTDPATGQQLYTYTVVDRFAILGGTTTNCAGGELPFKKWMTCEEVVKRQPSGLKHGYNFEVDAMADGPVVAVPIPQMGRFAHEATTWRSGILYQTEDRSLSQGGACLYRYIPDQRVGQSGNFAETTGPLEALAVKG
nr:PhoX family protein [Actinomycetota bacterium]